MNDLREQIEEMLDLYVEIKREVKRLDQHLFERWKAGGYIVDEDIMSMYPDISKVLESLENSGKVVDNDKPEYEDDEENVEDKE
jgi:hypothetical protein